MSWPRAALGDICEIVSGATPKTNKPEYWDGEVAWATPKDLSDLGTKVISNTARRITSKGLESCSATMLPPGAVLFSSRAPIGLVAIAGVPMCTNQGFKSMVPRAEKVDPHFLYWWLLANSSFIQGLGRGATFKEVSKQIVSAIQIPLPPLPEQKRIAAILDAADTLRAKRRESIEQLNSLIQATFLEMFGDPAKSPRSRLESVCCLITDGTHQTPTYCERGIKFLSSKDVKTGSIDWSNIKFIPEPLHRELHRRLSPQRNDILLAKNGTTGTAAIVDTDEVFDIYVSLALLRPNPNICPVYLLHAINSDYCAGQFKRSLKGVGVPNLHLKEIRNTEIPIPPLAGQHRFASIVESIEQQKARLKAHLAELDTLFASLQSRAFNGELVA